MDAMNFLSWQWSRGAAATALELFKSFFGRRVRRSLVPDGTAPGLEL